MNKKMVHNWSSSAYYKLQDITPTIDYPVSTATFPTYVRNSGNFV
jgi:hypothetical protein